MKSNQSLLCLPRASLKAINGPQITKVTKCIYFAFLDCMDSSFLDNIAPTWFLCCIN